MCSIWDFKIDLLAYAHLYTHTNGGRFLFLVFFGQLAAIICIFSLFLYTSHIYKFKYVVQAVLHMYRYVYVDIVAIFSAFSLLHQHIRSQYFGCKKRRKFDQQPKIREKKKTLSESRILQQCNMFLFALPIIQIFGGFFPFIFKH